MSGFTQNHAQSTLKVIPFHFNEEHRAHVTCAALIRAKHTWRQTCGDTASLLRKSANLLITTLGERQFLILNILNMYFSVVLPTLKKCQSQSLVLVPVQTRTKEVRGGWRLEAGDVGSAVGVGLDA